jgi:predicted acetyltransferase
MPQVETQAKRASHYEIIKVPEGAMDQAENIWSLAFGQHWPRDYARYELSTIYGAFDKADLHAVSAIVDMPIHFAGRWTMCGGIAAVATAPGQRYQNLITMLLQQCVQDLHDRQVPFSALHPFSYPFYERLGWAVTHWLQRIEIATGALRKLARRGNAKNWTLLPADRCEEILPVHDRFCEQYNLCLRRSAERCRQITYRPGHRYQYFIHSDGYMLWDLDLARDRKLHVLEFVHTTEDAYWDGLALLGQMDAQYDYVSWHDVDHELLLRHGIPEPRPFIQSVPWMMSRIVHLESFEKLLPRALKGLSVYDPLGVSAPREGDISVGELLQLVTGVWRTVDERFPAHLHGIVSDVPNHSLERY